MWSLAAGARRATGAGAQLIKKIYEIDPLLCAFCGGEMKIIAFITEHATVGRILRHLDMPPQRPEPVRKLQRVRFRSGPAR